MCVHLTILLIAVLVRVCVAVLVTVCLGESCDVSRSIRFSWRLVQKLLQLLLIQLTGRGWMEAEKVK